MTGKKDNISNKRPAFKKSFDKKSDSIVKTTNAIKKTSNTIIEKNQKKRGKRRSETFSSYIFKVLKQVHSETGISKKSMEIMNSFIYDLHDRIALEASKLVRYNKKHTMSAREIQSAVKLLLPGELAKHAIIEGAKAVNKFASLNK